LDFLSTDDDDCGLCRLRFSDLKSKNERWKNRSRSLQFKSADLNSDTTVDTVVEMPGGRIKKKPFKIRVRMTGSDEAKMWPVQIERIGPEDRVMASVGFSEFQENDPLHIPREVSIGVFNEAGNLALRIQYVVRIVEIDQPLAANTFRISFDDAEGVWDSNNRKFIKEKQRKSTNK
jgi:hypothetical protein